MDLKSVSSRNAFVVVIVTVIGSGQTVYRHRPGCMCGIKLQARFAQTKVAGAGQDHGTLLIRYAIGHARLPANAADQVHRHTQASQ